MFTCYLYIRVENKYISAFGLDVIQIELCVNITCVVWKSKAGMRDHFNMPNNVKQYSID